MTKARILPEDTAGLALALLAHGGLFAWLMLAPAPKPIPQPERISVTIADETGLKETSVSQGAEAAAATAPELADQAAPEPAPAPPPPALAPKVMPKAEPSPLPRPAPVPAPVKPAMAKPAPAKPVPAKLAPAKPVPAKSSAFADAFAKPLPTARTAPSAKPAGGSRIGADFLKGVADSHASGTAKAQSAAVIGPAVQSALSGAISRQLKPRWVAPQGADAEKLVTVLAWSLNADGSLAGKPVVVRQEGITDANRPQAARHAEQAIRAVELAAPFTLPSEYYDAWKRVASFRFDRKLSQ